MHPLFSTEHFLELTRCEALPTGVDDSTLKVLGARGREWQLYCFEFLKDKRFVYFVAFMGSGKSLEMKYLATYELVKSKGAQKQVVLVPLKSLHKGFRNSPMLLNDFPCPYTVDQTWLWNLGTDRDLCAVNSAQASGIIDALIKALVEPLDAYQGDWSRGDLFGRVVVTTDLALALAWQRMTPEQKNIASGNSDLFGITYNKDEAHRVLMPNEAKDVEEEEDDEEDIELVTEGGRKRKLSNAIGDIFAEVLKSKRGGLRLATGTFTRGNRNETILGVESHRFSSYEQDFVEYYKTLGIEKFSLTTFVYNNELGVPELLEFIREKAEKFSKDGTKWMLMLPHRDKGWRREGFFDETTNWGADLIFKVIAQYYPEDRVLDFVDDDNRKRDRCKERLDQEPDDGNLKPSTVDVAVGVNTLSMGVDWPGCSVVINTVNDRSIINLMQKPGRAFRKFHEKSEIKIYSCIPRFVLKEGMTTREVMSDYTNQILAHFFMKDMLHPIVFNGLNNTILSPDGHPERPTPVERVRDRWREGTIYADVLLEISDKAKEMSLLSNKKTLRDFQLAVVDIIKEHDSEFPPGELEFTAAHFVNRIVALKRYGLTSKKPSGPLGTTNPAGSEDVAFIREEFDKVTMEDVDLFDLSELSDVELTQIRTIIRNRNWDVKFDEAKAQFERAPAALPYIHDREREGKTIEWTNGGLGGIPEPGQKVIRWILDQRQSIEELSEARASKIRELFKVEEEPAYELIRAPRPPLRRGSLG